MTEIKYLHQLVYSQIDTWESYPAVVFDDGENKETVSYSLMNNLSKEVSVCLSSHVLQNEVVGVCMQPNVHTPTILLGILECGASFYNFESTSISYVKYVIKEVGIRCLIMDKKSIQNFKDLISEFGGEIIPEPALEGIQASLILLKNQKKRKQHGSLAYCITTSGTTGSPKIVRVPHSCILPNIIDLRKRFCVRTNDVIFLSSPLTFDPSIVDIFVALSSGACLLIVPHVIKMMPKMLLDMLYKQHNVTIIQATPTLVSRLDNSLLPQTLLSETTKLRVLALGGEKFPPLHVIQQWRAVNNKTRIFNLYGTTEVSCWATCHELLSEDLCHIDKEIPLGSPLTHTRIVVKDRDRKSVHKGQGELFIESLQRKCYLYNEEPCDNDAIVSRGTGDIVQVLDNGDIIYLYRTDDQVKRNGQRINLCEIKKAMLKLPYVKNCEVLYQNGKLAIFVTLADQGNKELPNSSDKIVTMEKHIRNCFLSHYWPDYIQCLKVFPITRHGKLDKDAMSKTVFSKKCDIFENQGNVGDILRKKWEEVLSVPIKNIDSSARFLMCGGDSFSAVTLADQLELTLGFTLPMLLDLILHNTFSDICSYIEEEIQLRKTRNYSETVGFNSEEGTTNSNLGNSFSKTKTNYVMSENDRNINFLSKTSETSEMNADSLVYKDNFRNNYIQDHDNWTSDLKNDNMPTGALKRNRRKNTTDYTNDEDMKISYCKKKRMNKYEIDNLLVDLSVSRGNRIQICNNICEELKQTAGISDDHYIHEELIVEYNKINRTSEDTVDKHLCIGVTEAWKYNTGKCVDASPLLVRFSNGLHTVYIGSHSYKFSAVTMETGQVQWEVFLGDRIESSACLSMHTEYVVVGCYDGAVYCLNAINGDIWWEFQTEGEVKSSPVLDVNTGLVIFGSHDKHVYALNVEDKICAWKTNLNEGSVFSSPCVGYTPHHVYVCTLSGCVAALDPFTGSILWSYDCTKPIFSSPVLTCDGLCVGCVSSHLLLLDFEGKLKWSFPTGGLIFSSPVSIEIKSNFIKNDTENFDRNIVIVGSHDGYTYGMALNGDLLWKFKCESAVYATIFCFHLRTPPGCLKSCCDEKKTGISNFSSISTKKQFDGISDKKEKILMANNSNDDKESKISVFDQKHCPDKGKQLCLDHCDICIAASTNGVLYLIDIRNGDLLHTYKLPGQVFSSPVLVNNHIIVGCRDDFVYCLKLIIKSAD